MALQPASSMVELLRPNGGRVQVEIGSNVVTPELEAEIAELLFEVEGTDGDICDALTAYAQASGLTTRFFVGREYLTIEFSGARHDLSRGSA